MHPATKPTPSRPLTVAAHAKPARLTLKREHERKAANYRNQPPGGSLVDAG
jgi:nitrate reductase cytochrome c-type subunit